jgi:hypothetical protein
MQSNLDWKECPHCGDDVSSERWALGEDYQLCKSCGEMQAQEARESWTVIQEYGKGGYMFVTAAAAARTLKETNQKQLRS